MSKYKFAIVINDQIYHMQMSEEYANEEEAKEFLRSMREIDSIQFEIEDGDMIAISGIKNKNVYFTTIKHY